MKHQIDPTVDCVFKAILGKEGNKNLLIHFLNAVLEPPAEEKITEVLIMNPYNEREFEADKLSIVDIRAKDEMDNNYQVEIQIALHANLPPRMLYMWSSVYRSLLNKGESYSLLTPVISIWILTGTLFPETGDCHLAFMAWNQKHNIVLCDHFAIHVLQLPEWRKSSASITEKDRWMYFFREGKNTDPDEEPPKILNTDEMRQAMSVIKDFSENQKNYLLYQDRLAALSEIATWRAEVEQAQKEKQAAVKKAEKAEEKAKKEKEKAKKEKEKAKKEKEKAKKEKEKLLLLLKKAGIDPEQAEQ
ncbi:MAG: Rpn family recombination-promoting nuclease/putative transposase [Desulfobacterales bacterium]|nr:Rpn family recombination-promoting nuclease/putative transposase [Desulfobacterales bacterium]